MYHNNFYVFFCVCENAYKFNDAMELWNAVLSAIESRINTVFQLTQAQESVNTELRRLDAAMEKCLDMVDKECESLITKVEARQGSLQTAIRSAHYNKKKVLEEQHSFIEAKKAEVERECEGLQYQVENISKKQRYITLSLVHMLPYACTIQSWRSKCGISPSV